MRSILRGLLSALFALCLYSCQGHGRVHEAPPPSYPDREAPAPSDDEGRYAPAPPAMPEQGYATPPASAEPEAAAAPPPTARDSSAAQPLEGRGWGRGAPARKAPSAERSRAWREERPGLATHWGEARYSPTRQVDFERASFERPAALLQIHYNDRDGALDMLPRGSWGQSALHALGGAVEISMVDASGRPFSALRHGDRVVAMGDPGERYSLLVHNRSGERFEVVATVDGLDVLDGEDGSLAKRGYLVSAYSSVMIDGFRRSDAEVAAFRLGDVARSYAASKGKARNVGVIGIALFDERQPPAYRPYPRETWPNDETWRRRNAEPFPGRYARPPAW
jgi:hypothetical protein